MNLRLELRWFSNEPNGDNDPGYEFRQLDLLGDEDRTPALVSVVGESTRRLPLGNLRRNLYRPRATVGSELGNAQLSPCIYVSPYGGERTATLGNLWDRIALSDLEGDVVDALRIIDLP